MGAARPFRRLRRHAFAFAGAALSLATSAGAVACILAFSDPDGIVAHTLALAPVEEVRAEQLLRGASPDPARLRAGAIAGRRALAQGPTRAVAWLDVAYADALLHGALTSTGITALRRSYVFEPLGPDVSLWRVRFALEHWDELPSTLRGDVLSEIRAEWRVTAYTEWVAIFSTVRNPAGRLASQLVFNSLHKPSPKS